MAGGIVLQVDQAASADQGILRYLGERGQVPSLDRHIGLRPRRHRQETHQVRCLTLHNPTNSEFDLVRENTVDSSACKHRTYTGEIRND
jgi:hypothetical protein